MDEQQKWASYEISPFLVRRRHTAVTSAQSGAGGQPFIHVEKKNDELWKYTYQRVTVRRCPADTSDFNTLMCYGVTVVKGCFNL